MKPRFGKRRSKQLINGTVFDVTKMSAKVFKKMKGFEMGERVGPRLRELASRGRRKPGGGIHAT